MHESSVRSAKNFQGHDRVRGPRVPEDSAAAYARMEALRTRFGDDMPPEYAAVSDGEALDTELLARWYKLQPLEGGKIADFDSDRLIGVYIDTGDDSEHGRSVEHVRTYHHFSDEERDMVRSVRHGAGRISFGRELDAHVKAIDRRIDLQLGDGIVGSRDALPREHVQFGGRDGVAKVRDVGGMGKITLVYERPKEERYLHEHFSQRQLDVVACKEITPHMQAEISHVAAAVLDGGQLPTDILAFNQLVNDGAAHSECSRAELQQVLQQLRDHQIHPQGSVLAVQTEGRRNRIIRGIETVLNPLMAAATVSAETRSAWKQEALSRSPDAIDGLEKRLAIYRSALESLDAEWGTWQSAEGKYITRDNGLRDQFERIHSVAYVNHRERAQQRQQFFEAYRAWLEDAAKNLERVLVKKTA